VLSCAIGLVCYRVGALSGLCAIYFVCYRGVGYRVGALSGLVSIFLVRSGGCGRGAEGPPCTPRVWGWVGVCAWVGEREGGGGGRAVSCAVGLVR